MQQQRLASRCTGEENHLCPPSQWPEAPPCWSIHSIRVHPEVSQVKSKASGESLRFDTVKRSKFLDATLEFFAVDRALPLHRRDHQVFGRVFRRDELEHLGVVSGPFEQRRAQRVGDKLDLALEQDAMTQCHGENPPRRQLWP